MRAHACACGKLRECPTGLALLRTESETAPDRCEENTCANTHASNIWPRAQASERRQRAAQ
eukprot:13871618-Alexandrium_andersonii.AAC.1